MRPQLATNASSFLLRKTEIGAVSWLDLHCHLNAIYLYSHHQGRVGGPRSLQ